MRPPPKRLTHTYPDNKRSHSAAGHDSHQHNIRGRRRSRLRLHVTGSIITARLRGRRRRRRRSRGSGRSSSTATDRPVSHDGIPRIGGGLVLGSSHGSGASLSTRLLRARRRVAGAPQALADEARDDGDIQRRAVVEVLLVGRDEGIGGAAVQPGLEEDVRVGAGAQVEGGALGEGGGPHVAGMALLEVVGGVARLVLLVALLHAARELARVGGVGARVVLHVAGPAQGRARADKGVAVDGEGAVSG